jgi:hypothetical protein
MSAPKKIGSDFAILDVKWGRQKLAQHFDARPRVGPCPEALRIPVTVTGYIDAQWGPDDGESIEFSVVVESVEVSP